MNISICILTWNRLNNTKMLVNSITNDYMCLIKNNNVFINICDNGSTDGTVDFLKNNCPHSPNLILMEDNKGISISKNKMIEKCIKQKSEYMFMFDNDVSVINGSLPVMINFMENNKNVGCFGQHIDFYVTDEFSPLILKCFPNYNSLDISYNIKSGCGAIRSWTHYSVYRTNMFLNGIKFDENGPFGKPGYGFDDDDLGMQISQKGYEIACFKNIYCYHNRCSSVEELKVNGELNYQEREKYFKKKWNL